MTIRVLTTGVFDLFHIGHLRALRNAEKHGDHLLVGLLLENSLICIERPQHNPDDE